MRLNLSTDYALRLLMYLGTHPDRLCTIQEVAERFDISRTHLMKVANLLSQRGWVRSVRGKNGGLQLGKAAEAINVGAVVRDTEADFQLVECMGAQGAHCLLDNRCQLKRLLHQATLAFLAHLDDYTLVDLLQPETRQILLEPAS